MSGSDDICPRHDGEVRLRLGTLHTDSADPRRLLVLYQCPVCGFERRAPLDLEPDPEAEPEVA